MQEYSVFGWLWRPYCSTLLLAFNMETSAINFIHRFESPLCITIRHTFIVRLISHSATELSTNPGKIVIKSWLWCKSYNLLRNSLFFSLYDVFVNCNLQSKGLFYFNKPFIIHSHFINISLKDTNFWILWFELKQVSRPPMSSSDWDLTFTWHSLEPHLTTWPSSDHHLTYPWPLTLT